MLASLLGLKRAPRLQPADESIGMFTGQPALPQDPRKAMVEQILPTMTGPIGLTEAPQPGEYFGTDVVPPIRFPITGPPGVNQDFQLETAPLKNNGHI